MTFLTPIPALIAGAIALPVLVTFFLLKLRRRPVRVPSTMLWQQSVQDLQANVPFKWIRPSWLLLLAILILAMLLLALARPAIDVSAARAKNVVLLIDRSASMSAMDGPAGESRLEEARQRARDLVRSYRRTGFDGRIAVVAFASEARVVAPLSADFAEIERAIDGVTPSDQPGDVAPALALAEGLLQSIGAGQEGDRPEPGVVVLCSDGSFARDSGLTLAGAQLRFERVGPDPAAGRVNTGIAALSAMRDYEDPTVVRVFVRLENPGTDEAPVTLTLRLGEEVVERRAAVVPGADEHGRSGERAVTFDLSDRDGGVLRVGLEPGGVLRADDRAAVVLEAPVRPRILVVTAAETTEAQDRARWILHEILRELRPASIETIAQTEVSPERLDSADLVIIEGVTLGAPPRGPSISLGAGYAGEGPRPGEPVSNGTSFISWRRDHPLLRHVALDSIYVRTPRPIDVGQGDIVLARGRGGPLIAIHEGEGPARLVIGFDLAESNWPVHFGFPIFVAAAVDTLTLRGKADQGFAFATTDAIVLRSDEGASRVTVRDSDGNDVVPPREVSGERVPIGVIERVGVFDVAGGLPERVAVNLSDSTETAIATRDEIVVSGEAVSGASRAGSAPVEVWQWFVLAAGALLAIEWLVYALKMRS
ncbi:MAG: VWA domain-containing protein [Phycisphaeraceae bacterium]|nr:VWA domain-containing protein [Phycisphaeraceae bacterium]